MISSGMKRGLAASAVSALAVAGLPLLASSASANPMVDQLPAGTPWFSTRPTTAARPPSRTTVRTPPSTWWRTPAATATQIRFEYGVNPAGPFTTIATVSRSNGVFSTEWTPPTSRLQPARARACGRHQQRRHRRHGGRQHRPRDQQPGRHRPLRGRRLRGWCLPAAVRRPERQAPGCGLGHHLGRGRRPGRDLLRALRWCGERRGHRRCSRQRQPFGRRSGRLHRLRLRHRDRRRPGPRAGQRRRRHRWLRRRGRDPVQADDHHGDRRCCQADRPGRWQERHHRDRHRPERQARRRCRGLPGRRPEQRWRRRCGVHQLAGSGRVREPGRLHDRDRPTTSS